MSGSSVTLCPLGEVTQSHLKRLCGVLWEWKYCGQCNDEMLCPTDVCPWQRSKTLKPFFEFYRNATAWSIPEVLAGGPYALKNHDDLIDIIQLLKKKPNVPRFDLTEEYFSKYSRKPDITDQQRAFNLAIKVMTMVNCSTSNQALDGLELGSGPTVWANDKSQHEFIKLAFPIKDHPILHEDGGSSDIKRQLNATQLRKTAVIRFQGTDDLKNHLKLDQNTGTLQVYHHTTFLKEHLFATRNSDLVSDPIRREIIPRQLALETLDSLKILFPLGHDSRQVLHSLASQSGFDFDCSSFECINYRREDEKDLHYGYWGTRLMDLYAELKDPKPRGIFQWIQMRSKERHFMIATTAGVVFAVLLGLFTLAVGIFQAWISYQQWKHPVNVSSRV